MKNSYLLSLVFLFYGSFLWGQTASEWYKNGADAIKNKNYQEAIIFFSKAIEKRYNPLEYAYNERGAAKYYLKNYTEAIKDYDRAILLDENYKTAYSNRGDAKIYLKKYTEAIKDLDRAILLDKNFAVAYCNRGRAKYYLKKYSEAVKDYDRAILIDKNYKIAYNNRGDTKIYLKKYTEAIKDLDRAILLDKNFAVAYCNRGIAKYYLKNYTEAVKDYDRAILIDENYKIAYNNRGDTKIYLKKYTEAIKDLDRAILLDKNFAVAYCNRGIAKYYLGKLQAAKADYEKALSIDPNFTKAKNNLKYINEKLQVQNSSITTSKPQIWSVAVGIDQYQYDSHLTDLETPKDNAYEFVREVENLDFVDHRIPVLTNRKANKRAILNQLRSTFLSSKVGADDMIIFYFSGHGMTMGDRIGICPYDYFNPAELITDEDIKSILRRSPAKHKICIIEACKTEANTMASLPLATKQRFNTQRKNISGGIVYITSTKAGEESYEYPNMGAVFSHYFLRGIKGEADRNGNKTITIKELFDFLETNVSRATNNKQVPQINREGYRDIPFIVIN